MYSFSIEDEFSARIRKKIDPRQPNPLNIDIRLLDSVEFTNIFFESYLDESLKEYFPNWHPTTAEVVSERFGAVSD